MRERCQGGNHLTSDDFVSDHPEVAPQIQLQGTTLSSPFLAPAHLQIEAKLKFWFILTKGLSPLIAIWRQTEFGGVNGHELLTEPQH